MPVTARTEPLFYQLAYYGYVTVAESIAYNVTGHGWQKHHRRAAHYARHGKGQRYRSKHFELACAKVGIRSDRRGPSCCRAAQFLVAFPVPLRALGKIQPGLGPVFAGVIPESLVRSGKMDKVFHPGLGIGPDPCLGHFLFYRKAQRIDLAL